MTGKNFTSFSAAKEGATNVKLKDEALIAAKSTLQLVLASNRYNKPHLLNIAINLLVA